MEQKKNRKNSGDATANKVSIGGEDASNLIGSIVEKGISDSCSNSSFTLPPKLSVLPFPVARHRSHGPHWGPIASRKDANDDDEGDEDDEEDNDSTDFEPMSVFANPVQRKQKRGLDLRQWREVPTSDNLLETGGMGKRSLGLKKRVEDRSNGVALMEVDEAKMSNSGMEIDEQIRENVRDAKLGSFKKEVGGSRRIGSNSVMHRQPGKAEVDPMVKDILKSQEQSSSAVPSSLSFNNSAPFESDIDAENSARLQNMTPEEIADAQAEIMEKINPALLSLLKKRGQAKVKKQGVSRSEDAADNRVASTSSGNKSVKDSNVSPPVESYSKMEIDASKGMKSQPDKDIVQNSCIASGSLWSDWSKRVEAVRGLRFSLEGTLVTDDLATNDVSGTESNVAERDFLRTEGDPGAAGYTIKEAVQLTRSVIPGQRALALHILAGVLDKVLHNIQQHQVGCTIRNHPPADTNSCDWEAIWAYALGPEPGLVLALRMCLDDNHSLVVLACAKVIQCVLSCDLNEKFFEISEKVVTYEKDVYTAAIFRSKPEIGVGFLRGGFWKYNAKPSNILDFMDDSNPDDETEEKHTIQDDITVAGQDFAAGLVRMGILPRMQYLLETNPTAVLEECIIRILIAIARHSQICANAIMKCQRLVHTVVNRFIHADSLEIHPSKIKSVILLKVLAQSDKNNCLELIKNGYFQAMTQHLYQHTPSLNHWLKLGKDKCKLSSALIVEELRLWKVCIHYGCCISYFSDMFPALCLWLNPPTFEKLYESEVLTEFASIAREACHVLEALARKLPDFYTQRHRILDGDGDELETWSWNFVSPVVDLALKWIVSEKDPFISKIFQDSSVHSLLWVYSAVMHMLSTVLERVIPEDSTSNQDGDRAVPWLPEFVPKVGLEIIKHGFLSFLSPREPGDGFARRVSFAEDLCRLRQQSNSETSLASVCFLHGILRLVASIDDLIHLPKSPTHSTPSQGSVSSREGEILEEGIVKHSQTELRSVLTVFMKLVASQWQFVQSIETFSRGGPSPGVGVGWGSSGGGFWSVTVLLAQTDARLLIHMLKIVHIASKTDFLTDDEMAFSLHTINSVLGACLSFGPRDKVIAEKAFSILLQDSVFKHLNFFIQRFLQSKNRLEQFRWRYSEGDYLLFSKVLTSHFRNRWFLVKRKEKTIDGSTSSANNSVRLETIHEDFVTSNMENQGHYSTTLTAEWAHQRLPLPMHWFLSPISTLSDKIDAGFQRSANLADLTQDPSGILEVAKPGLFLLLGLEAMSTLLSDDNPCPIRSVPLVWKFHSLSVILLVGMGVLEDDDSQHIYEVLQDHYGQLLDEAESMKSQEYINVLPDSGNKSAVEFLRFKSEIHDTYSTFIDTLVEQFAGESFGNLIFGRQVAVYLHRSNESVVRLSAWNALSNARVLDILPTLEKCIGEAQGYLEPTEDNEGVLEAYVKSWVSGALDRAATRGTMAFSLALHHLSCFIFLDGGVSDKTPLRVKLAKSLLRDCSQKPSHEGMMLELIGHCKPSTSHMVEGQEVVTPLQKQGRDVERRFDILMEACDRDSTLLTVVDKLKSAFLQKHHLNMNN